MCADAEIWETYMLHSMIEKIPRIVYACNICGRVHRHDEDDMRATIVVCTW